MSQDDRKLVQELLDIEEGLTDWEVEFAESVSRWLDTRERLTDAQRRKVEAILARIERRNGGR